MQVRWHSRRGACPQMTVLLCMHRSTPWWDKVAMTRGFLPHGSWSLSGRAQHIIVKSRCAALQLARILHPVQRSQALSSWRTAQDRRTTGSYPLASLLASNPASSCTIADFRPLASALQEGLSDSLCYLRPGRAPFVDPHARPHLVCRTIRRSNTERVVRRGSLRAKSTKERCCSPVAS